MNENEIQLSDNELLFKKSNLFDRIIVSGFSIVSVVSSVVLTLLIAAAAFVRYVVGGDLYGYEEWVKLCAFWLYFAGGVLGAWNNTHVSADVIDAYLPEGGLKRLITFLRYLVTASVSVLFSYYAYVFFMFGFRGPLGTGIAIPMTTVWQIPLWTSYLAVFLGFLFMNWYFIVLLARSAGALLKGGR